jgi:uncharacterized Zn finger protein
VSPASERPWNLWDETPPPIPVEGGIAARLESDRPTTGIGGSIVRKVLDRASPGIATRGRAYARAGQTVSVHFEPGRISGEVQGSEPVPYRAEITFSATDADQSRFVRAVRDTSPDPIVEIPEKMSRDLRADLLEHRILVDVPVTVKCNCAYRGVCKHLVAFASVATELLDASPARVADVLGVTARDLDAPAPNPDEDGAPDAPVSTYDRRRQAALARTLAALDRRSPTRDDVLERAAEILVPPPAVAGALDLDLYLDPIEAD